MHDIEPYYHWRHRYVAADDEQSPFFGTEYDEFSFSKRIYNYLIHPQWDEFGSPTLYVKVLYVDYDDGYAILELIGEWNDCLTNDIMHLKRNVIDPMLRSGIFRFCLICENVLNFHASDECYYEEWFEDVAERNGWVAFVNTLEHVEQEMSESLLGNFVRIGGAFSQVIWRSQKPKTLISQLHQLQQQPMRSLP